jgi:hypothetical protein
MFKKAASVYESRELHLSPPGHFKKIGTLARGQTPFSYSNGAERGTRPTTSLPTTPSQRSFLHGVCSPKVIREFPLIQLT